ncbi:MAG: hypothetical protein SFX74_11250 [Fimbriimonadaceae bacterium]|nr:hypothetical protein [Fimbriimonadaceae bacterium]
MPNVAEVLMRAGAFLLLTVCVVFATVKVTTAPPKPLPVVNPLIEPDIRDIESRLGVPKHERAVISFVSLDCLPCQQGVANFNGKLPTSARRLTLPLCATSDEACQSLASLYLAAQTFRADHELIHRFWILGGEPVPTPESIAPLVNVSAERLRERAGSASIKDLRQQIESVRYQLKVESVPEYLVPIRAGRHRTSSSMKAIQILVPLPNPRLQDKKLVQ